MYEYIAEFERWKKINKNYQDKYKEIQNIVDKCKSKCIDENCSNLCKKPIVDIEKFNLNMTKRLTADAYEVCSNKIDNIDDINQHIYKMKMCCDNLFKENETTIKKETLERMNDIVKFLNI